MLALPRGAEGGRQVCSYSFNGARPRKGDGLGRGPRQTTRPDRSPRVWR